jgi:hypothetical protein
VSATGIADIFSINRPHAPLSRGPDATDAKARGFAMSAIVLVVIVHVWIVSAGWFSFWPRYTSNYSLLADGFLHGQLSLRVEPSAKLLGLADPYDPKLNQSLRLHDMSLYQGRYYLYWGPVPAILEMPFLWLFHKPIGDQFVTFAFVFGLVLGSSRLLMEIRRQALPNAPPWTMAVGVMLVGLATPIPFLLSRAAVYEAAIAGGQCFLIWGMYWAISSSRNDVAPRRLFMAGACWGLAVGCRSSLVLAVMGLAGSVVCRLWIRACIFRLSRYSGGGLGWGLMPMCAQTASPHPNPPPEYREREKRETSGMVALVLPLAVTALLLAAYNHARFGRWSDFGPNYQLAGYNVRHGSAGLFSIGNILPNLYAYTLKPVAVLRSFPFVQATGGANSFPSWVHLPHSYLPTESVAGLVWCCPFLIFALVSIAIVLPRGEVRDSSKWIVGLLLSAAVFSGIPAIFLLAATMRYMADFVPSLMVLAIMGWWGVIPYRGVNPRLLLGLVLAGLSVGVGVLLAVIGNSEHFPTFHPGICPL